MNPLLRSLRDRRPGDPAAVERFLSENSFPIVEGTTVTFVWRGAADQVFVRHWIYGLDTALPLARLEGTELWFGTLELPLGSRVEYKLEVVRGDQHRLVQDPLNPLLANDPFGANSVVHAAGYTIPDWTLPDPDTRRGELREHHIASEALGGARPITVYLPARFRPSRRYPLLVVHDGQDYLRFAGLQVVLDNLIHRLEIPPMIVAATQASDRMREYADDERHGRYLVDELVPLLAETYPLVDEPASRGLMGASLGALATLSTAWRHPGFFGNLLLQSGSFVFTDIGDHDRGPAFDPVVEFMNAFRAGPGRPAQRLFLSCGIYESMIYYNRSLLPLLQGTGMVVRYAEARDGHNWENWRDRLREGLSWLFPGPLWMVYE